MCFAHDASPPDVPRDLLLPPVAGGAAAEALELTAADGNRFAAAMTPAAESRGVGVLVMPDVRGLYPFYTELTERLASAGHHAIAYDFFGRTAGPGPRDEDFDYWPHVTESTPEHVREDGATAIAELRDRTGVVEVVVVGFCFGGAQALLAATDVELDVDGVVAFYGALDGERLGIPSPLELTDRMRVPVLGLYGGADQGIPVEQVREFDAALERSIVDHEITVYDDAPHSFFDRKQDEYAEECEDAWRRTLAFLERFADARRV